MYHIIGVRHLICKCDGKCNVTFFNLTYSCPTGYIFYMIYHYNTITILKEWAPTISLKITWFCTVVPHNQYLNSRVLQSLSVYPGLHPPSQCPVVLLQGSSFKQLALQLPLQSYPNVPSTHSTNKIRFIINYSNL